MSYDFGAQDAKRLVQRLLFIELCLALAFLLSTWMGKPVWVLHALLDLDGEQNIPAWFSAVQLAVIGLVLLCMAHMGGIRPAVPPIFFLAAGLGFLFLSMDESAALHEKLGATIKRVEWVPHFKAGLGAWIAVYAVLGGVLVLASHRALITLWTHHRRASLFVGGGLALIAAGGVGLEIVSYQYLRGTGTPELYALEVACEEFLEMAGATTILYGVLLLLINRQRGVTPDA